MNFNFHEFRKSRQRRLFIPMSAFSFASFIVPIKFRQPVFATAAAFSGSRRAGFNRARLDGRGN
jgi:hypothetical protein